MLMAGALESVREQYRSRNYQQVVQTLAELPREVLLSVPEQGYMLADAARRVGGITDILGLVEQVVVAAQSRGDSHVLCSALNLQGVILLERGQTAAAERAWCDLVIVASAADDPQFVARASNNLGVAATIDMRLSTAITNFQRAITSYLRLGYARGCAQAHQNLGIVFRELNHAQEAHKHFRNAITFAQTADCIDDVARAEQEAALLMVYAQEDLDLAEQSAQRALGKFTELAQPAGTAEALRVLAVIALARRRYDEAEHSLTSALAVARDLNLRLLEGEILLAQSRLARLQNDPSRGYSLHQRAEAIFRDINAPAWGEQVLRRMEAIG
jgi:tetratricopeptide (TPR) repeat protein